MAEIDRLDSCGHGDCTPLGSFDGRLCVGRMPVSHQHLELRNTHRICWDEDDYEINIADAYYIGSLMAEVIKDVQKNHLYNPCNELAISDPVRRLKERLSA